MIQIKVKKKRPYIKDEDCFEKKKSKKINKILIIEFIIIWTLMQYAIFKKIDALIRL